MRFLCWLRLHSWVYQQEWLPFSIGFVFTRRCARCGVLHYDILTAGGKPWLNLDSDCVWIAFDKIACDADMLYGEYVKWYILESNAPNERGLENRE